MTRLLFIISLTFAIKCVCSTPVPRCTNLFDEGCGIGAGKDEEWITGGNTPGKRNIPFQLDPKPYQTRCANLFDEGCSSGGVVGGGRDEEWITGGNTPGKRNIPLEHAPKPYQTRCANLFDEGCSSGGIVGGGRDEEWITGPGNTPGKRDAYQHPQVDLRTLLESLEKYLHRFSAVPNKRCANLFDEGCSNGGLIGSGKDEGWLNNGGNPGRR